MCEVLLRVVDKINADPYKDCKLLKAGDVVVIQDDGWTWGTQELINPDWRIIKIPGVSAVAAAAFLGEEFDADPAHPSRMLRRRAFSFDYANAAIPAAFKAWLADATRVAPTRSITLNQAQLAALKKAKVALLDPNVIG